MLPAMETAKASPPSEESGLLANAHAPTSKLLPWAAAASLFFALNAAALLTHASTHAVPAGDFQNHIVLMPWAFVVAAPMGIITWRVGPACGLSRDVTKAVHALFMTVASVLAAIALFGIIKAHSGHVEKETKAFGEVHFQSAHSWMGILAATIFFANLCGGLLYFYGGALTGLPSPEARRSYLPVHIFFGYVAVALTMFSVPMGIMSYAYRGTLEHGPSGPGSTPLSGVQGGRPAALEYRLSVISIVIEMVCMALVFFVTERSSSNRTHPSSAH